MQYPAPTAEDPNASDSLFLTRSYVIAFKSKFLHFASDKSPTIFYPQMDPRIDHDRQNCYLSTSRDGVQAPNVKYDDLESAKYHLPRWRAIVILHGQGSGV